MTAERRGTTCLCAATGGSEYEKTARVRGRRERRRLAQIQDHRPPPPIILYETSWCGYCRKARRLLKELDADFEARDVERDAQAAAEARSKSGGGGVPVLDFGGVVVKGYSDRTIRHLVRSMREQGALPAAP